MPHAIRFLFPSARPLVNEFFFTSSQKHYLPSVMGERVPDLFGLLLPDQPLDSFEVKFDPLLDAFLAYLTTFSRCIVSDMTMMC
jgi:hypothetical protein